jgi:hypothetical protein
MPSVAISAASSGDNTLIAAVTGRRIVVTGYVLISSGTVNAAFKSGASTALTGAFPLTAQAGASAAPWSGAGTRKVGWFATSSSEALVLNLSGAVGVYGHLTYEVVA